MSTIARNVVLSFHHPEAVESEPFRHYMEIAFDRYMAAIEDHEIVAYAKDAPHFSDMDDFDAGNGVTIKVALGVHDSSVPGNYEANVMYTKQQIIDILAMGLECSVFESILPTLEASL